jgi:2-oxo-3-hexenedioate decarboxylase
MRPADAEAALRAARKGRQTLTPFTDADPTLDDYWGYDVQSLDRTQRVGSGESVIGAKLGLTSAVKQQRMNVDQPIVGFLTDTMRVAADSLAQAAHDWAQPRIEPEIAFITAQPLTSPLTLAEAGRTIEAVTVAAEIIDSRYHGYRFRLPDVVADNTSAAGFMVGPPSHLPDLDDLARVRCEVEVGGMVVHAATGAAILGHPLHAIVRLSRHLARHGQTLPEGSLVLAGALTDAVPLVAGNRYTIRIDALGVLSTGV